MIPSLDVILFFLFGAVAVGSSLAVVTSRNPMHSVLLLIVSFAALAWLYIGLDSPFTAVTQIIVYAGAIMVLFLFVVMLLNAPREDVASPYGPAYVTLTTGPRKAFALLLTRQVHGRPFVAPPGTPPDVVAVLKHAFLAMAKDPAFLQDAAKMKADIIVNDGAELAALYAQTYATPRPLVERAVEEFKRAGGR